MSYALRRLILVNSMILLVEVLCIYGCAVKSVYEHWISLSEWQCHVQECRLHAEEDKAMHLLLWSWIMHCVTSRHNQRGEAQVLHLLHIDIFVGLFLSTVIHWISNQAFCNNVLGCFARPPCHIRRQNKELKMVHFWSRLSWGHKANARVNDQLTREYVGNIKMRIGGST